LSEETAPRPVAQWGVQWMIRLRWVAVGGIAAAPALSRPFGVSLPATTFLALAGVVAAYNAFLDLWVRRERVVPEVAIHAQIVADLVALTAVFHFAGGIRNPLLPIYGFHVFIAATVLSRKASFSYAALGVALLALLAASEQRGVLAQKPGLERGQESIGAILAGQTGILFVLAYLGSVICGVLRRREADLRALNRSLGEQDRAKSQYVLMLSHSILVRLGDIERALQSALRDADLPEIPRGMLGRAERWLRSLRAFVEDVLNLSRIRAAGDLARSYLYLPRIVHQVVQDLEPLAAERSIELSVRIPDHVPALHGNAQVLSQAIGNLLRNAIAYSDPGCRVEISLAADRDDLKLVVEDRGMGIAEKDLPHIFEEFYRAEEARQRDGGGSGVGLTIVKYVAELHRGEVLVESEEGKGSRFTLRLPAL